MLFTKAALRPEIDATFTRPLLRQFGDCRALGPEETREGDEPEPEGDWARGGYRWDHVQVGYGYYEEQDQIAATEYAIKAGLLLACWNGSRHFGPSLWFLLHNLQSSLVGFAHLFRPRYAGANLGHPSDSRWIRVVL